MLAKAKKDYEDAQRELKQQEQTLATAVDAVKQNLPEIIDDSEEPIIQDEALNAEEPVESEPIQPKVRPQTPVSNEDYEKKEAQRAKFEKIKARIETKKEEAAANFKAGAYAEAIKLYKNAADQLDNSLEDFPLFKKEICQLEAGVYNNIAFCYGKDQHDKLQIEYSTMVIDRSLYLDDINVLVKAYLRRGLAYEHMEKYKPAVHDLIRVRELQPQNKQAQTAINRCLKYIE